MSIIFQLYRAEDLSALNPDSIEAFRKASEDVLWRTPEVLSTVRNRAFEVFKQLIPEEPDPTVIIDQIDQVDSTDRYLDMLALLFDRADVGRLSVHQRDILRWAIICEITHSAAALQVCQRILDRKLAALTGRTADTFGSDAEISYRHFERP
jgi:hypothetical protein